MKKMLCLLLAACMSLTLAACGGSKPAQETEKPQESAPQSEDAQEGGEWTRDGYYTDEEEHLLSVTWMEDLDVPGWYVGCMLGKDAMEDSYGGTLQKEGKTLKGSLPSSSEQDPITVTISEEGETGLLLSIEGGEEYHFKKMENAEASIIVSINTEGWGSIAYEQGETEPEIDPEYPFQSAQINLNESSTYTFLAAPQTGSLFVKWTKNGEDYSTEPQITVLLEESADYIAVFEEDPDWQNPSEIYAGQYKSDSVTAMIDPYYPDSIWVVIEKAGSDSQAEQWIVVGKPDPETQTITYSDCTKWNRVYDENGDLKTEEMEYDNGSGTIVFGDDGTFTWHDDQAEDETDMVFELTPAEEEAE